MRIAFVCQAGDLEYKSTLLAASLRHVYGGAVQLIAAVPQPSDGWGELRLCTRAALDTLDVAVQPVTHAFGRVYPIANKIAALIEMGHGPALLMDSDILCLGAVDLSWFNDGVDVAAKPSDGLSFDPGWDKWEEIYRARGLKPPIRRLMTTVSRQLTFPYFNAGVVYTKDSRAFGCAWMRLCHDMSQQPAGERPTYWLDQIALPLAIHTLGWSFKALTETWNYPAEFKPLNELVTPKPGFSHYHRPWVIEGNATMRGYVRQLLKHYPCLNESVDDGGGPWRQMLDACRRESDVERVDYVLTGPPCSGSSVVGAMLRQQQSSLVVDEPQSVLRFRKADHFITELVRFHAEHTIRPGAPTFAASSLRPILGTRSTLGYLSRLDLIRARPEPFKAVICIRDPHATVAAWTRRSRHLATADVDGLLGSMVPGTVDSLTDLQEIAVVKDVRLRRALLWRHMAGLVSANRHWVTVVRYEDLVAEPAATLAALLDVLRGQTSPALFCGDTFATYTKEGAADDPIEARMIADICGPEAEAYGYAL